MQIQDVRRSMYLKGAFVRTGAHAASPVIETAVEPVGETVSPSPLSPLPEGRGNVERTYFSMILGQRINDYA